MDVRNSRSVEAALTDIGIVVSCVAQPETPHLLLGAVAHGCGYTDIAPMSQKRPPYPAALAAEATRTGASIILGAGLVPGLSNVLARMGADAVGAVEAVETTCLLSVGDQYGTDSRQYLAQEFATEFKVRINGEDTLTKPFTLPKKVRFEPPLGAVRAYAFPFSDQIYFPATLDARTSISRLALLPQWISMVIAALAPVLGTALTRNARPSERLGGLMDWLKRKYKGLDWWGVHVEVRSAERLHRATVQGRGQANATAVSASAFVRALVEGEVDRPGIWTADQVVPTAPFLKRLATHGLAPAVALSNQAAAHSRRSAG